MQTIIKNADLNGINLAESYDLSRITFKNCKMQGAIFPAALTDMYGIKMYDCIISNEQLENFAKIPPYGVDYRIRFDYKAIKHKTYCTDTHRVRVIYEPVIYVTSFEIIRRIYPKTDIIGYKILWNKMYR